MIVTDPSAVGVIVVGPETFSAMLLPLAENCAASGPVIRTLPLENTLAVLAVRCDMNRNIESAGGVDEVLGRSWTNDRLARLCGRNSDSGYDCQKYEKIPHFSLPLHRAVPMARRSL